jgi:D-alanyl-D-alanine carboxypeptidase
MYRVSTGASFGLRCGIVALASMIALAAFGSSSADARGKRKYKRQYTSSTSSYQPRYADIVVDANTGDVLHSTQPDSQRHPASLTKIMTLYLLFERLEAGKIRLDTQMPVSAHAASQAPTKLGLRPGQTLAVEDAIKALVTKSANDAAVVVAETLADSEEEFATLMTRKARALRMSRTVYKNASGLPDSDQVTTARDQALLGLAIQDRFPRYYRYFSTASFTYRGHRMANHNRLLGRVDGVNGIKTGYTRASGFNLVSAVQRGERRIVAVVLGGQSAGARDAKMRSLIEQKVSLASLRRTAPKIVEVAEAAPEKHVRIASAAPVAARSVASAPKPEARASETRVAAAASADQPAPGSTEPIRPLLVKTLSVKAAPAKVGAPMSLLSPEPISARAPEPTPVASVAPAEPQRPESKTEARADSLLPPPPPGARPGVLGVLSSKDIAAKDLPAREPVKDAPTRTASIAPAASPTPTAASTETSRTRSGWIVQVGAFEDQAEAKEKLAAAKAKAASLLGTAEPYTEVFAKGDKRYYRARFAGLKESAAEQVCRQLHRSKIACFTVRN